MLSLSNSLVNKQVLSLRSSTPVADVEGVIINPDNLKVEGFYCKDLYNKKSLVLTIGDIRETTFDGYIVNDHEVLVDPEDLIRLREVLNLNFVLIGKSVETVSKEKIGKVSDYVTDTDSMFIQKLYVSRPLLKALNNNTFIVDRNQINEINSSKIIINDLLKTSALSANVAI